MPKSLYVCRPVWLLWASHRAFSFVYPLAMQTFTSRHYPHTRNALLLTQEYAMRAYAGVALVAMVVIMLQVARGEGISWVWVALLVGGGLIANVIGNMQLRRTVGAIIFTAEHFTVLSVADIAHQQHPEPFPLAYSNPAHGGNVLTFHYHDQVLTLSRADWPDFDTLWVRFNGYGLD